MKQVSKWCSEKKGKKKRTSDDVKSSTSLSSLLKHNSFISRYFEIFFTNNSVGLPSKIGYPKFNTIQSGLHKRTELWAVARAICPLRECDQSTPTNTGDWGYEIPPMATRSWTLKKLCAKSLSLMLLSQVFYVYPRFFFIHEFL